MEKKVTAGFFLGYGLFPFWGAIIVVVVGSFFTKSSEYGAAAPWLIILGIPLSGAMLIVCTITAVMRVRDIRWASAVFWICSAPILGYSFYVWSMLLFPIGFFERKSTVEADFNRARQLVREHPAVVREFGPRAEVDSLSSGMGPYEFRFSARLNGRASGPALYAVVRVEDSWFRRKLKVECVTSKQPVPTEYPCPPAGRR